MSPFLEATLSQLGTQSPILLAYAAGIVLGLVNSKRCPTASAMTVAGSLALFLTSVIMTCLNNYLIFEQRNSGNLSNASMGSIFAVTGVISNLVRAGAFVLILAAVFSGRPKLAPVTSPPARP